ncbi:MAG: carboxypeptidase regulatory-like domain-containing protein [Bacteroidales bacterium]|nr:carboxypeptidase regulatory-like domain-containing protein [Bacteroidales bacterium]
MNKILTAILTIVCTNLYAQHPEKYFRFVEADRDVISTKITHIVSIDKKSQDTLWAYANANEFEQFTKLGYKIEILTPPSLSTAKALNMATTAEQMVNWDKYPTYEVYRTMLQQFEDDYPALCKLDSIGTTANGRKLYVLKISDNVLNNEAEPELFYTSTMHGDETTGYILMLRLADSLLQGYSTSSRIKEMVDNMAIYINPNANPDGTYYYGNNTVSGATRYNGNSIDLNRNFPDPRTGDHPDGNSWQPETQAMMDFAEGRNFVLSANFHGGVELANYPWDTWESADNPHPDHNWYYTISRAYADTVHLYCPSDYFTGESNGVTHGGDWYVVTGGRQDYMNYWQHCREFTLEISDTKLLGTELLPAHWTYNKASILNHMELAYTGLYGTVTNAAGDALPAKITILNHDKDSSEVFTNPSHGNYYRMISPGIYTIKFTSTGYNDVTITDTEIGNNENRIINIVMDGTITPQNISGTVLNNINNAPIANASVVVTSGSTTYQTITNADGQFTINSVLKGLIRIDVTAAKFYATTYHQNLTATQTAFTIKLMGLPLANVSFAIKSKNEPLIMPQ